MRFPGGTGGAAVRGREGRRWPQRDSDLRDVALDAARPGPDLTHLCGGSGSGSGGGGVGVRVYSFYFCFAFAPSVYSCE